MYQTQSRSLKVEYSTTFSIHQIVRTTEKKLQEKKHTKISAMIFFLFVAKSKERGAEKKKREKLQMTSIKLYYMLCMCIC